MLIEAKDQFQHGGWIAWLKGNCEFSVRQAQQYMQIAREWPEVANAQHAAHLSQRQTLALIRGTLGAPDQDDDIAETDPSKIGHSAGESHRGEVEDRDEAGTDTDAAASTEEAEGYASDTATEPADESHPDPKADEQPDADSSVVKPAAPSKAKPARNRVARRQLEDFLTFDPSTPEAHVVEELVCLVLDTSSKHADRMINCEMLKSRITEGMVQRMLLDRFVERLAARCDE